MTDRYLGTRLSRRSLLAGGAALGGVAALPFRSALAADQIITLADIGVGDPGGDWSSFEKAAGYKVNLVSIGNAPSGVLNQLIAGGGRTTFDVINIVGGMQPPLVENDLIMEIDTSRLPNWGKSAYIKNYLAPNSPGFKFIGENGKVYGVPTVLQADAFAYLPDKTGPLDSYSALFDPKFRGYTGLEDNYTTAGQKTALYLKASGQAKIDDPADMTPQELKTVIDFLIAKKKDGQFRVVWSSFEQAVQLLTSQEVYVLDCWEPMVFAARAKGQNVVYASPKEGFLLWAMAAYIVKNPNRSEAKLAAIYKLLDYMLGPEYGAVITKLRGYMTSPDAPAFAAAHPDMFPGPEAKRVSEIDSGVKKKFAAGGTWQNRWPKNVDAYEEEWQRFKAA
jgi:putative spermidine/putrescine transport system substrate-binding protein